MKHPFSIMKRAYLRVGIWGLLLLVARYFFFTNIRLSEEFTWWVKITIAGTLTENTIKKDLGTYLTEKWFWDTNIGIEVGSTTTNLSLKTNLSKDEEVAALSKDIQEYLVQKWYIKDSSAILEHSITWPSVWSYMQRTAKNALIVWVILMAIYMMFAFATIRKEIAPGLLAAITIVTMIFDVSIPAWAYGIRMMIDKTMMVDTIFIIAVLTNMGYSINDTIIIFDRIRENIKNKAGQKGTLFGQIFEASLWQTMRRSFGTVMAIFLVILAMFVLGTGIIQHFAFTIWIWVIAWSYSSIFISAPLVYILLGKYKKERKQMLEQKD